MDCECAFCKDNKAFDLPNEIVEATAKGDVVLFCGAGISTEGKNVLPFSFYSSIQEELGVDDSTISFSELMQQYCDLPNGRKNLLKHIRNRFQYIRSFAELERQATAFHRELSDIFSIRTIITTNWDTYFEEFCGAIPITIPEDFAFWDSSSRYVLKIHGSIDNLSSIVATADDYKICYERLQNGIIGATLKSIIATKTIVFVGFSFGDEDFTRIMEYLRVEMGSIYPHIYVVTLDESLDKRLNYNNCTCIITSGIHFLHQLKNVLIEKGIIENCSALPLIKSVLDNMEMLHSKVSELDLSEYPCAIYTLAYQDGVIHAWERFIQNYNTGEYNRPGYIARVASNYGKMADECSLGGNYWDMSYYEGYANGLVLIKACDMDPESVLKFPFLFVPGVETELSSFDVYLKELKNESVANLEYESFAKRIIGENFEKDMVVHHPPY